MQTNMNRITKAIRLPIESPVRINVYTRPKGEHYRLRQDGILVMSVPYDMFVVKEGSTIVLLSDVPSGSQVGYAFELKDGKVGPIVWTPIFIEGPKPPPSLWKSFSDWLFHENTDSEGLV